MPLRCCYSQYKLELKHKMTTCDDGCLAYNAYMVKYEKYYTQADCENSQNPFEVTIEFTGMCDPVQYDPGCVDAGDSWTKYHHYIL